MLETIKQMQSTQNATEMASDLDVSNTTIDGLQKFVQQLMDALATAKTECTDWLNTLDAQYNQLSKANDDTVLYTWLHSKEDVLRNMPINKELIEASDLITNVLQKVNVEIERTKGYIDESNKMLNYIKTTLLLEAKNVCDYLDERMWSIILKEEEAPSDEEESKLLSTMYNDLSDALASVKLEYDDLLKTLDVHLEYIDKQRLHDLISLTDLAKTTTDKKIEYENKKQENEAKHGKQMTLHDYIEMARSIGIID